MQQKELFSISDDAELSLMQTMVCSSDTHAGGGIPRAQVQPQCPTKPLHAPTYPPL